MVRANSTATTNSSAFLSAVARIHLSLLIKDPFVREAFERAERDGLVPIGVPVDVDPPTLDGSAAVALDLCEA